MIYIGIFLALYAIWYFLLRPRPGGKDAPPLVTSSTVYNIPIFGVMAEFFSSPNTMMTRCYKDYGNIFTIPIGPKRLTVLLGSEAQELLFRSSDDVLSINEVYSFMKPVFGPDVVYDAPKKKRQVQFQALANGLRVARLKSYVAKVEEEARKYFKTYLSEEDGGEIDIKTALSELTILTASRCLHGDDVRAHIFKEIQELYHQLDEGLLPITVFWPEAPIDKHFKRNAARKEMERLFLKTIEERRADPTRSDGTDVLKLLMDCKYKDGSMFTDQQMCGWLIALLFAGQHTSCISSTWTSLFIANDGDILNKVMEEQKEVLQGDMNKPLTYEMIQNMEYLGNCMKESLRLCPTFIMVLRRAECDIDFNLNGKDYVIPEGDYVVVSPTVASRLKSDWKDPDMFDPMRFAPPREEHKKPYSYLGFGGGVHSCMGQNFALLQVKTILSVLFREYEIERVAENMPAVGYEDMVVGPKGDCRVRYRKRAPASA